MRAGQVDRYPALVVRRRCEVNQTVSFFIPLDIGMTRDPLEANGPCPDNSGVQKGPNALRQCRFRLSRAPAEKLDARQGVGAELDELAS